MTNGPNSWILVKCIHFSYWFPKFISPHFSFSCLDFSNKHYYLSFLLLKYLKMLFPQLVTPWSRYFLLFFTPVLYQQAHTNHCLNNKHRIYWPWVLKPQKFENGWVASWFMVVGISVYWKLFPQVPSPHCWTFWLRSSPLSLGSS